MNTPRNLETRMDDFLKDKGIRLLPPGITIQNGGWCDLDLGGPCACGSYHTESQIARIQKEHAEIAAHNEGQPGLPQGPCNCDVCKLPKSP